MMTPLFNEKHRAELESYVREQARGMEESAVVFTLFTDGYKKGIDSLLQFAVAMMQDKPFFLLVPKGTTIPEKIRRMADGIEHFDLGDKGSLDRAAEKLLKMAQEKGFCE